MPVDGTPAKSIKKYRVKPATVAVLRRKAAPVRSRHGLAASGLHHRRDVRASELIVEIQVPDLNTAARVKNIIEFFGSQSVVAQMFKVHRGQPGRWASGQENPTVENKRLVIGVENVTELASLIWTRDVALDWLNGFNAYLDGARPIDVLTLDGPTRVLEALDAALEGSFS